MSRFFKTTYFSRQSPKDVLPSTMMEILNDCPHFRVLVVGKSGVGKSSLINAVFGVDTAHVSHDKRGKSDINVEIKVPGNPRVVVHDSLGMEPGETENLRLLKEFVTARDKAELQRDKLDFVWLCIQVPIAGERVLEKGTEDIIEFLTGLRIPFLIVFTQYDRLVEKKHGELLRNATNKKDEKKSIPRAQQLANKDYEKHCVSVVNQWAQKTGKDTLEAVQVSTDARYMKTLENLIQSTIDNLPVDNYDPNSGDGTGESTQTRLCLAQNVDPRQKIAASIRVGEMRYWRGLASSTHFPGLNLDTCLHVLHKDIVSCWSIRGGDSYLESGSFEKQIIKIVGEDRSLTLPKAPIVKILGTAAAASGVSAACAGPAAPVVAPVVFGGVAIAAWLYNAYQSTPETIRWLMRYIVDLTNIMFDIFLRTKQGRGREKTKKIAEDVCQAYEESETMERVHVQIETFVNETQPWKAIDRDHVLDKIKELLEECADSRLEQPQH